MKVLKWVGIVIGAIVVLGLLFGEDEKKPSGAAPAATSKVAAAPATTPAATTAAAEPKPPPPPPPSARSKLRAALGEVDAKATVSPDRIAVDAKTPDGGFEGASTGDLNRRAGKIFAAIHEAGFTRSTLIKFKGKDLPDAVTGTFKMSRDEAKEIAWDDEDALAAIDWSNYRLFAHPALKQDG